MSIKTPSCRSAQVPSLRPETPSESSRFALGEEGQRSRASRWGGHYYTRPVGRGLLVMCICRIYTDPVSPADVRGQDHLCNCSGIGPSTWADNKGCLLQTGSAQQFIECINLCCFPSTDIGRGNNNHGRSIHHAAPCDSDHRKGRQHLWEHLWGSLA